MSEKLKTTTKDDLNSFLSYRIDKVLNSVMAKASKVYKDNLGLTIREMRVVRAIAEEPGISVGRLSDITLIEPTLISKHLKHLLSLNYIERRINEKDARQFLLYLTSAGSNVYHQANIVGKTSHDDMLTTLTHDEIQQLDFLLKKLNTWVEKP